jgi:hypothetical protein
MRGTEESQRNPRVGERPSSFLLFTFYSFFFSSKTMRPERFRECLRKREAEIKRKREMRTVGEKVRCRPDRER